MTEEDPARAAWLQCAHRARAVLAAASGLPQGASAALGGVGSDYAGGLAAALCALAELAPGDEALAGDDGDGGPLAGAFKKAEAASKLEAARAAAARQRCAALAAALRADPAGALRAVHNAVLTGSAAAASDPTNAAAMARALVEKHVPAAILAK